MHSVQDKKRRMTFEGTHLSSSSSRHANSARWIEFDLYRTDGGQYVTSRVGYSTIFHTPECRIVGRNRLTAVPGAAIPDGYAPCPECAPARAAIAACPELPRSTATLNNTAAGVVKGLWQEDRGGTLYLTDVARSLLERAAEHDKGIAAAYGFEHID